MSMTERRERPFPGAALILLSIFLALVIQSALDDFLSVIIETPTPRGPMDLDALWSGLHEEITLLRFAQMAIFFMLLGRFYLGAFRFNQETSGSNQSAFIDSLVDLVGTALLFVAFYALSTTVSTTGDFYLLIVIMHGADALWFVAVMFLLLKGTTLLAVARWYLVWDGLTIVWFGILSLLLGTERSDFALQWSVLAGLLLISAADWWILRGFYFEPLKWRETATA